MLEVEIKARCDDLGNIKKAIINAGGTFVSTELEDDSYFNHPSRDFGKTDEALRIRKVKDMVFITYKGPKIGGKTKTRFEREVQILDAEAMLEILQRLGFVLYGRVQKKRDVYLLHDITICCDDVKNLGTFVELEMISNDREEAEKRLFALASTLGLKDFITASYLEMVKSKDGSIS